MMPVRAQNPGAVHGTIRSRLPPKKVILFDQKTGLKPGSKPHKQTRKA
jgi:hypothetical protein